VSAVVAALLVSAVAVVAVVIVLAHVACCSRSTAPTPIRPAGGAAST
jgi:hypothetical protein